MRDSRERKKRRSVNLYDLMEIPKDSSQDEIRAQYKRLALKNHPDKNLGCKAQAEETMKQINRAHDILGSILIILLGCAKQFVLVSQV